MSANPILYLGRVKSNGHGISDCYFKPAYMRLWLRRTFVSSAVDLYTFNQLAQLTYKSNSSCSYMPSNLLISSSSISKAFNKASISLLFWFTSFNTLSKCSQKHCIASYMVYMWQARFWIKHFTIVVSSKVSQ